MLQHQHQLQQEYIHYQQQQQDQQQQQYYYQQPYSAQPRYGDASRSVPAQQQHYVAGQGGSVYARMDDYGGYAYAPLSQPQPSQQPPQQPYRPSADLGLLLSAVDAVVGEMPAKAALGEMPKGNEKKPVSVPEKPDKEQGECE
jgi:hypothetical protein